MTKYVDCKTGGVTPPAIAKVTKAVKRYAPQPVWLFHSFELSPSANGEYAVNFILEGPEGHVLVETDGLSWGYGGEGPHGLATVLTFLFDYYGQTQNTPDLANRIFRWVIQQPQDKPQTVASVDLIHQLA